MTYFQDLTPYSYSERDKELGLLSLNIGWLAGQQPFSRGETPQEFRTQLFQFCLDENLVHIYRGFHECEICNLPSREWAERRHSIYGDKAEFASIGDGEIRVIGESAIYAAPALIYHYVVDHEYKPPDDFIQAVMTGPQPGSEAHRALLENLRAR